MDEINEDDTEYVRADLLAASERAREEAEAENKRLAEKIGSSNRAWLSEKGKREKAEERLRMASVAFEYYANRGTEEDFHAVLDAIDGDLPPCPECAKANAQLAAIKHEAENYDSIAFDKRVLELLASDPEVIAVVDGWVEPRKIPNPWVQGFYFTIWEDGFMHADAEPLLPVTITITRNTKAKEGE